MILTVHERLKLLEILPLKESYEGITEIHRLSLLLSLTTDEQDIIEVEFKDGKIHWNQDKALTLLVDIPMGEWMTNIIRGILKEKSHEHDLEPSEMSLYEKFIMDYE